MTFMLCWIGIIFDICYFFFLLIFQEIDTHDVDVEDKTDWSSRTETIFIHIVHDHVKKGDLQTSTFTKKIWTAINDVLFEQSQKRFNVGQLKSNFNRLHKKYREFSDLIAHIRFGWDLVSNMVTASEAVWARDDDQTQTRIRPGLNMENSIRVQPSPKIFLCRIRISFSEPAYFRVQFWF